MSSKQDDGKLSRPQNDLLRTVSGKDYKILRPYMDPIEGHSGQALYHPGDAVENVYFPCGPATVSFAVAIDEDREVEVVLVGCEGAVGGVVSRGFLPAYSRIAVKIGGPLLRLSARRLEEAQRQSQALRQLFARYADCFISQIFQSAACNAGHSIEQRAAKWIIDLVEHTGTEHVPLTHEQFAGVLGVGRSYASRVLQGFKAVGILETARGTVTVRDVDALHRRACKCDNWVKKHFAEVLVPLEKDQVE
jgi:hypothetical protein